MQRRLMEWSLDRLQRSSPIPTFGLSLLKGSSEVFFPQPDWHCCTSGPDLSLKSILIPLFTFFSRHHQTSSITFSVDHKLFFFLINDILFVFVLPSSFLYSCGLAASVSLSFQYACTQYRLATYVCERVIAVNLSVFDLAWLRWKLPLVEGPYCIRSFCYCLAQLLTQLPRLTVSSSN